MGYAVPAAIGRGAGLSRPARGFAGRRRRIPDDRAGTADRRATRLPRVVLVLRDRELAQIAQFQQIALGRKTCSELPDYDLAAICRGVGAEYLAM